MNITGDLYLQVYNNQSGRFLEIPRNQASISFKTFPTGYNGFPHTLGFSGFSFSGPIAASRLDMLPINIGGFSVSGSGSYHLNLGLYSVHNFSKLNLVSGDAIGSHNIGYFDMAYDSINSYNLGSLNTLEDSNQSFNIGISNINSGSSVSYNLGTSNVLQTGLNSYLVGRNNNINSGNDLLSIGINNTFRNVFNGINIGTANTINNSQNLNSFGNSNSLNQSSLSTIVGKNNILLNANNSYIFGELNTLLSGNGERIYGDQNISSSGSSNFIVGINNNVYNFGNSIFGRSNDIDGSSNITYGNSNTTTQNTLQNLIFGNTNNLSGATNNTILGFNNNSNQSLYSQFVSGIFITGSYGETKLDRIYLTGANATGFFKYIANTVGNNLYTGFTFNGLYTTTDFITYSKNLGMGLTNSIFGRINYDSANLYGNGDAWILTLDLTNDIGGTYPAYTSYNLTGWSGLANVLGTTFRFTPNPTGRLSGYVNDNVNGFYNRGGDPLNTILVNSKGHSIIYDSTSGWGIFYNNVRTGDLPTTFERIYNEINGTNFSGWSGLKSYNSGSSRIATGIVYQDQLDAVGGDSNFYAGNNNITTLNNSTYALGNINSLYNNNNSYVIGRNNILSNSISSYVLGQSNSLSGSQNYIIGNGNQSRSGDFNSIFIGNNYTPTGSNKVSTISLASLNNRLEVTPSEIRFDCVNRPQVNDENIIIQSEFDTLSNTVSNALPNILYKNGPVFPTNIFQDPYYDKLADKIFISGFTYDSGAYNGLTSSGQEFTLTTTLFLNNFNIFSNSYSGANGFNVIFGRHSQPQFSPTWLIVDNTTSGVYYKNDSAPSNTTPQTGWYATGFNANGELYTGTTNNLGANIVIGSRQGYISATGQGLGTFYIPYFY